jgi:hypothetical protein
MQGKVKIPTKLPIEYDNVSENGMLTGTSILSSEMPHRFFSSLSLSL